MAMLAFSHFEKSKNQFQLIRHLIHDTTLFWVLQPLIYELLQTYREDFWAFLSRASLILLIILSVSPSIWAIDSECVLLPIPFLYFYLQ
jgi:hypothetical protein